MIGTDTRDLAIVSAKQDSIMMSIELKQLRTSVARLQENLKNRRLAAEHLRDEIVREVRDVVRSVGEAKDRLQIYEQNREVAEMTYNIYKMRFENGGINSQELATEQEHLQNSQLGYLNAYITYPLAVAELKRKTLWDFEEDRSYLEEVGNNDQ